VKDFHFVDAVSGTPLSSDEKGYALPVATRMRRTKLAAILVVLIASVILLTLWAFS
jgi:hypothetical protein